MKKIGFIVAMMLSNSFAFGADFLCQGTGQTEFASKIVTFDLNKSETKELAKINGVTAQVALDASNKDGKPYLSIEIVAVDLTSHSYSVSSAKGPIVKDMVVILTKVDSKMGNMSIVCSPF